MALGGIVGSIANAVKGKAGDVNGSQFPKGTWFKYSNNDGEIGITIVLPNKEEIPITHDKVKAATVLAMGVINIEQNRNVTTSIYGTKYLCVLKDGRQAVITVGLGESQYALERVLF